MFRQMVYRAKTKEPVERFQKIIEDKDAWNKRVAKEIQEVYRRRVVTITDHATGADFVAGIEDSGLSFGGWSRYNDTPFLVPTRSPKGDNARELLKVLGTSPPFIKIMAEEFDVPPYFRTQREVYYPGFDMVPIIMTDPPVEPFDVGDLVDLELYVVYNVWPPDHGGDLWDGGDHFEQSTMARYYGLKGF
jgi:hypothetical protein